MFLTLSTGFRWPLLITPHDPWIATTDLLVARRLHRLYGLRRFHHPEPDCGETDDL